MDSHASTSANVHLAAEYKYLDVDDHDDEPMLDPATGRKIPRPRNAWILYRKTRLNDVPLMSDGTKLSMAQASSLIAQWWRTETQGVRRRFELMAADEKAEHKRLYPDYKYKPRTTRQIAVEKEKKRIAKRLQQDKDKQQKKKPREPTPPPLMSMAHTSYLAAALANQAARQQPQTVSQGPAGPSSPLSLSSTPITTPSPLPLSDFEQGSSSTTATSQANSSPGDTLGLSLAPTSFNFTEQKLPLRAPRHIPARIPPRPKGKRQVSAISTTSNSRIPSSSSVVVPSPVVSTPSSLSPHAWPSSSRQPSPQSGDDKLSADLVPQQSGPELYWDNDSSTAEHAEGSGAVTIDLEFNSTQDINLFNDLNYFSSINSLLPETSEGVFPIPAEHFIDTVPGQIDVNLFGFDTSEQERERFAAILDDFNFSAFQTDGTVFTQSAPPEVQGLPDYGTWEDWSAAQGEPSFTLQGVTNEDVFSGSASAQPQPQQTATPGASPTAEYPQEEPAQVRHSVEEYVQAQQVGQPQNPPQEVPTMPFSPDVLADPDFQAMWARYLEQKQQQNQQQNNAPQQVSQPTTHHSEQRLSEPAHNSHPHYTEHHYQPQYATGAVQQPQYDTSGYSEQHHSQPTAVDNMQASDPSSGTSIRAASAAPQTNRYVPPAGAMYARTRRVGGSWRPPPSVQQEAWSQPQTPVASAPGSRQPSWATGVSE